MARTLIRVGVVGARVSPEVQRLRRELRQRGAEVLLADLSGFPAVHKARLSLEELRVGSTDLGGAPVWLLRQPEIAPRLRPGLSLGERLTLGEELEDALLCDREVRAMVGSLLSALADAARVVNRPEATELHSRKPLMMARLKAAGVPVPESLTTTDRASAEAFIEAHRGQVICKSAAGLSEARLATETLAELPADRSTLRGPLLFQRRITGGPSLGAYLVGDEVVSCGEILHGDVVDWRTDQRGVRRFSLAPGSPLARALLGARSALGLDYAGIDVELDKDGAPFVLDVNPAPLFASYERATGDDVAGPLADALIRAARGGSP